MFAEIPLSPEKVVTSFQTLNKKTRLSKTHKEAEQGTGSGLSSVAEFLDKITVTHTGNTYRIEIVRSAQFLGV